MKKFLEKVRDAVVKLFQWLTKTAKNIIPIGIHVVNIIKTVVDTNAVDFITRLTKTDIDDKIIDFLRTFLPKLLKELGEWHDVVEGETDQEILQRSIIKINSYPAVRKHLLWLGIATAINQELGGLDYETALTATHETYNNPHLLNA